MFTAKPVVRSADVTVFHPRRAALVACFVIGLAMLALAASAWINEERTHGWMIGLLLAAAFLLASGSYYTFSSRPLLVVDVEGISGPLMGPYPQFVPWDRVASVAGVPLVWGTVLYVHAVDESRRNGERRVVAVPGVLLPITVDKVLAEIDGMRKRRAL